MFYLFFCKDSAISLATFEHSRFEVYTQCIYLFIYLAAPCSMQDLVSRPGIEPVPPALGAQGLNHWSAREVPIHNAFKAECMFCQVSNLHVKLSAFAVRHVSHAHFL